MEVRGILQQDIGGDAPRAFGSLEHKFVQKDYGLTLVERWSTDNNITTEASIEDKFLVGSKLTLLAGLSAHTGKRNAGKWENFISHNFWQPYLVAQGTLISTFLFFPVLI